MRKARTSFSNESNTWRATIPRNSWGRSAFSMASTTALCPTRRASCKVRRIFDSRLSMTLSFVEVVLRYRSLAGGIYECRAAGSDLDHLLFRARLGLHLGHLLALLHVA